MPAYQNPGVYVSENPLSSNVRAANNTQSVPTFLGTASRGPLDATLINSWAGYRSTYGDVSQSFELGYSVYHYFANGGRDAYITRVASGSASSASASVPYYPTGGASATMFTARADNPGVWGAALSVVTTAGSVLPSPTRIPSFNLTVNLSGSEVERWNDVSTDPTSSRYVESVVNNYSKYINVTVATGAKTASATWAFFTTPTGVSLTGGSDGGDVSTTDWTNAINKLDVIESSLIMNAPGIGGQSNAIIAALISKAETRGNSFVVIDPTTDTNATTIGANIAGTYAPSSYAAVYYPMLKMVDPTKSGPGAVRDTYPGGAVLGAYIRSEVSRTVAKAPAGYNLDIRNAFGLTANFTPAETATLYDTYGVNTFKAIPGGGIIINGARTLDKTTPGKYIPIRRSLNYVKQALKDATNFAVFEPNDERLWTALTLNCSSVLSEFWRRGGLKGASAQQAFYVTCDSTNNTAETLAQGQVVIEVGVAVQYPAEFVIITISQWTGGSNAISSL